MLAHKINESINTGNTQNQNQPCVEFVLEESSLIPAVAFIKYKS